MDEDLRDLERRARTGSATDRARWLSAVVREGRGPRLLDELLASWRKDRAVATATILEDLSARLAPPPLEGEGDALHERWFKASERRSPVELPAMLATLTKATHSDVMYRLEMLDEWPEDPRIASALAAIVDEMPFRAQTSRGIWSWIFKRLLRERDPRTIPLLAKTLEKPSAIAGSNMQRIVAGKIEKTLTALRKTVSAPAPEEEPESDAAPSAVSGDALLDAIYDDPTNLERRIAYGEALRARGEPRGEFIFFQLARHREELLPKGGAARERKLLTDHRDEWLEGLAPALVLSSLEWKLGFLAAAETKERLAPRVAAEVATLRAWKTVERLDAPAELVSALLGRGLLPSLRQLTTNWGEVGEPAPPLLADLATSLESREDLAAITAIPGLERLRLFGLPCGEETTGADDWRQALERCPKLTTVEITAGGAFAWTLTRAPSGRLSALLVDRVRGKSEGQEIADTLARLAPSALERLEVELPAGSFREPQVREAAKRFEKCDVAIRLV